MKDKMWFWVSTGFALIFCLVGLMLGYFANKSAEISGSYISFTITLDPLTIFIGVCLMFIIQQGIYTKNFIEDERRWTNLQKSLSTK